MPLNRNCLGKQYPAITTMVTADAIQKYARACNEEHPRYFDSECIGGMIAPPMFAAVVTWLPIVTAMTDPELGADLLRLLHTSQEMEFFAPIQPGDELQAQAQIVEIESAAAGETLTLALSIKNQCEQIVNRARFRVLIRGRRNTLETRSSKTPEAAPAGEPFARVTQSIDRDQTYRYAEASGDVNPIHVDENVARMAGLPGIVVHGLCTMAFAARALIDTTCDGDPLRLRQLAVTFSRPVFPGDRLTTAMWLRSQASNGRAFSFETTNSDGLAVLRDGSAFVAS